MNVLRYFITSKAKRNILKLFFKDIKYSFYTREVARLTGEPLNAVRRELGYLEKAGLLKAHMQGNQKYHEVDPDFPLLSEWRKIILETPDAIVQNHQATPIHPVSHTAPEHDVETFNSKPSAVRSVYDLVEVLHALFTSIDSINMAIIHGKSALSEELTDEGIDLLVVGDINKDRLLELVVRIEDKTHVQINLLSMSRSDFDYRNARGDPLIRRIWSEKKLIIKGRH